MRLVEVYVQQRTARVERPLTYGVPDGVEVGLGDVVRVPLGPRELFGYVIAAPREAAARPGLRALAARIDGPPAFDAAGLALARWMAGYYCCSLGEALGALVFAAALPRVVDRFEIVTPPAESAYPNVPARLLRLLREDLAEGFALEALLRHPEARRAGDRKTLLGALGVLQRGGALARRRTFVAPRVGEARERYLEPGDAPATGPRVRALAESVRAAGSLRRRDALLEGYSPAVIARAVRSGALRETSAAIARTPAAGRRERQDFEPTAEQRTAIDAIAARVERAEFAELLIQGVTGSGKTFAYIRAIARTLALGARAIVLVPEISLTPQTARRFEGTFGERVAVLHSGLSDRERFESWQRAARGEIDVVVGARSAVFAPLPNVRLIVVDEAHESSYKQDGVPRYDAPAVARRRMQAAGGTLVLGSATPPLEAYAAALRGAIGHVRLDHRATAQPLPETHIVDLAAEFERGNRRIFSTRLVDGIGARLARGEKTVLFVNRRGSASFMLCAPAAPCPNARAAASR